MGDADVRVRGPLVAGWLAAGFLLLRFWDLTLEVERFLLWTALATAAYALTVVLIGQATGGRSLNVGQGGLASGYTGGSRGPWSDVLLWSGLVAVAGFGALAFPRIVHADGALQTVAILRILDIVLPIWILHRGVHLSWGGRHAAVATLCVPAMLLASIWWISIRMPGESFAGALPEPTEAELEVSSHLRRHVEVLSDSIGSRGFRNYPRVVAARTYGSETLRALGYEVAELPYVAGDQEHRNLEVTIPGTTSPEEIVVVGAHYDSYDLTEGADDNASGVASVLELARLMEGARPARTLKFVLFGTEEPPFFNTDDMGSRVYARAAREARDGIVAVYALEMLGYFSDEPGSQNHPPPFGLFFPDRGDFLAFVGNPASGALIRRSLLRFRETTSLPSEGVVSSSLVPGVELSDHASFWRHGYPAVLITDTGPFRNPDYHLSSDVAATLDYHRMARAVLGIQRVIEAKAGVPRTGGG